MSCIVLYIHVVSANPCLVSTSEECVLYSQRWQPLLAAETLFCFPGSTFKANVACTAPTFEQESSALMFSSYLCVGWLTSLLFSLCKANGCTGEIQRLAATPGSCVWSETFQNYGLKLELEKHVSKKSGLRMHKLFTGAKRFLRHQ